MSCFPGALPGDRRQMLKKISFLCFLIRRDSIQTYNQSTFEILEKRSWICGAAASLQPLCRSTHLFTIPPTLPEQSGGRRRSSDSFENGRLGANFQCVAARSIAAPVIKPLPVTHPATLMSFLQGGWSCQLSLQQTEGFEAPNQFWLQLICVPQRPLAVATPTG